VDIGVHQDGLVHISQLSDRFVDDPKKFVKVGQIVKVRVLEVNESLKRISLTMKAPGRPAKPQNARIQNSEDRSQKKVALPPEKKAASVKDLLAKFKKSSSSR